MHLTLQVSKRSWLQHLPPGHLRDHGVRRFVRERPDRSDVGPYISPSDDFVQFFYLGSDSSGKFKGEPKAIRRRQQATNTTPKALVNHLVRPWPLCGLVS